MKRGAVVGIAITAVAVIAGGVFVWSIASRGETAEDGAMRYLDALASGDVAAVQDALAPDVLSPIAATAFASASDLLTDPAVEGTEPDADGTVAVSVSYTLGGDDHTATLLMGEESGRWVPVADHLGTLTATTTLGDSVRVGDALIPAGEPAGLLPAAYAVDAAPAGVLAGSTPAVVVLGAPTDVAVTAALSPEATTLAQTQLDDYAEGCAAPAATIPASCGIRVPWGADLATLTSLAYRIDTPPVVVLSTTADGFVAGGGVLVVTATGVSREGATTSFTYRDDDWTLRGGLSFAGDEMVLSVW